MPHWGAHHHTPRSEQRRVDELSVCVCVYCVLRVVCCVCAVCVRKIVSGLGGREEGHLYRPLPKFRRGPRTLGPRVRSRTCFLTKPVEKCGGQEILEGVYALPSMRPGRSNAQSMSSGRGHECG
jgi:hypothetical protein